MFYVIAFVVGLLQGAVCLYLFLMDRHKKMRALETESRARLAEISGRERELKANLAASQAELSLREQVVAKAKEELDRRVISYDELRNENAMLKRDLQNVDVTLNKLALDVEVQAERQKTLDDRSNMLAERYLSETAKQVVAAVGANNFAACKQRLLDVIGRCRDIGYGISPADEAKLIAELKTEFENAVKATFEREEQARIKAQIREEQKLEKEIEREMKQLERERAAIQAALDRALAEAADKHNTEILSLQARLAEAEARKRDLSMAQQTKAGFVYVISNIGSFGEGVFKVGMTRRLEPMDRVRELGNASVPFPFDVHMMIKCDNAPSLENALHRELHRSRVNKSNPRKEYFKTDIGTLLQIVKQNHGEVQYKADPEALEYRQSITMSDDDAEFIERVYEEAEEKDSELIGDAE